MLARLSDEASLWADVRERPPALAFYAALARAQRTRRLGLGLPLLPLSPRPEPPQFAYMHEYQRSIAALLEPGATPLVCVAPSSIPASGSGVFAAERLQVGQLCLLYPGCVFSGLTVPEQDAGFDAFTEAPPLEPPPASAYVLMRAGGVRIDASGIASGASLARLVAQCGLGAASGHLVQHPPVCASPNVVDMPVDINVFEGHAGGPVADGAVAAAAIAAGGGNAAPSFAPASSILPWRLLHRVPMWYAEAAGSGERSTLAAMLGREDLDVSRRSVVLPGIALVATREIEKGEELFLDYAFFGGRLPPWYVAVSNQSRWDAHRAVVDGT